MTSRDYIHGLLIPAAILAACIVLTSLDSQREACEQRAGTWEWTGRYVKGAKAYGCMGVSATPPRALGLRSLRDAFGP